MNIQLNFSKTLLALGSSFFNKVKMEGIKRRQHHYNRRFLHVKYRLLIVSTSYPGVRLSRTKRCRGIVLNKWIFRAKYPIIASNTKLAIIIVPRSPLPASRCRSNSSWAPSFSALGALESLPEPFNISTARPPPTLFSMLMPPVNEIGNRCPTYC